MRFRAATLLALAGCHDRISNAALYADDAFAAALPGAERLGAPLGLDTAPAGPAAALAAAAAQVDIHLAAAATAVTAGEALRASVPLGSSTFREWEPVYIGVSRPGAAVDFVWVRGDVTRAGAEHTWQIEGAASRDGPWVVLGSGVHEETGAGSARWSIADEAAVMSRSDGGVVEIDYAAPAPGRAVTLTWDEDPPWTLLGARELTLSADLPVTGPSLVTTEISAWHGEAGGRATGVTVDDGLAFEVCWDAAGELQGRWGDPAVAVVGDADACTARARPDD